MGGREEGFHSNSDDPVTTDPVLRRSLFLNVCIYLFSLFMGAVLLKETSSVAAAAAGAVAVVRSSDEAVCQCCVAIIASREV